MKKLLLSLAMLGLTSVLAIGATSAYFSDTETSSANSFVAGTLDLNIDGSNENSVKFHVTNMRPGNQPVGAWTLSNVGSLNGYIDLEDISVTSNENGCTEPERESGDTTCDNPGLNQGELQDVVNLRLYVDNDKDGSYSTGDNMFYNGPVGSIASHYDLNQPVTAGNSIVIRAVLDWWNTPNDNLAQGDDMTLNISFELGQSTAQ